mgnify:CR=1 FL=1
MASAAYAVNQSATVIQIEQKRAEYMGNPQLEDGHTRIANELFEAILLFPFSSRQLKVVMAVIRKTYGFNKKQDRLALSTLSEMTGVIKTHVCKAVNQLGEMNVIEVDKSGFSHRISLNKNYKEWKSYDRNSHSDQISHSDRNSHEIVTETATKPLPKQSPQKKERKKDIKRSLPDDFSISESVKSWAVKNGHDQLEKHLDHFKDSCLAKGYTYSDWDAAFRNAIKANWAKVTIAAKGSSAMPDFMRGAL